jgi:hypothetical protein
MYAYSLRTSRSSRTPDRGGRFPFRSAIAALCTGLLLAVALLYASASEVQLGTSNFAAPVTSVDSGAWDVDESSPRTCCESSASD